MLFENLMCSVGRRARLAGVGVAGVAIAAVATTAVADDYEDDCERRPTCEIIDSENHYGTETIFIPECPPYCDRDSTCGASVCAWVDLVCPDSERMKVEFKVDGREVEERNLTDRENRQKVFFEIPNFCEYKDGDRIEMKIKVKDRDADTRTECEFRVEVVCGKRPRCWMNNNECDEARDHNPMMIYDVRPGDVLPVLEFCAKSRCYERARVEMFARPPFMDPIGHAKGPRGDKVCIETRADDVVESGFAEGTYWAKFRCTDVLSGRSRVIKVGYRYTDPPVDECMDLPECMVAEGSSITVDIDSTSALTVCGSSPCDDCDVTISEADVPSFVTLMSEDRGDDGETCASYVVAPTAADAGAYTALFNVTDCNGNTTQCSIDINVPAAMPVVACGEDEAQSPNDTFADATVIDSGECVDDAAGVSIHGVLDAPVFMSGDVDYYRFTGLTPDGIYTATIVAGMNGDNGFTDTMLGWLAAEGVVVALDDNSGPRAVYSKIEFIADENGAATLAVSGHGDDDFDGMMSGGMEYEEYGRGGYMLSIHGLNEDIGEQPLERKADLNGDGVVDTSDLGMMIGVFGALSN